MTKAPQFQFENLDHVMVLLTSTMSNLIDKDWSIDRQAAAIEGFYAHFLRSRVEHEHNHTTHQQLACPFCAAVMLASYLNRTSE